MPKEENFDAANRVILSRWEREQERRRMSAEHVENSIKEAISNVLKSQENRHNVAKDLKKATGNTSQFAKEYGFGKSPSGMDEHITGYEDRYWEKE